MHRIGMMLVLTGALVACKGKDGETKNGDKAETPPPATETGKPGTPSAPTAPAASDIDVCSFATKEQIEGVLGPLTDGPKPQPRQGAQLAGCEYVADGGTTIAFATARPAREFEAR